MSLPARYREIIGGSRTGLLAPLVRGMLSAVEPLYGWQVRRKNLRFDSGREQAVRVPAPVISVGNLTVGGTGKTPLVCWIARWLQEHGAEVTLISRGYGSRSGPNDEALELAARLPNVRHLQNPDRIAAARQALASKPGNVLLLDDAFQHRRLARDLDVVLLDALQPFGYGHLLPRGLLREPVEGLARAQVIGLSRADAVDDARRKDIRQQAMDLSPNAIWIELAHQPRKLINAGGEATELAALRGKRVAAFCGVGNPAGFRHTLVQQCGVQLDAWREFPDHCGYSPKVLQGLEQWVSNLGPIHCVLCTRKDLVKIPQSRLANIPLWAVDVEVEVTAGKTPLEEALQNLLPARG